MTNIEITQGINIIDNEKEITIRIDKTNQLIYDIAKDFINSLNNRFNLNNIIKKVIDNRTNGKNLFIDKTIKLSNGILLKYKQNVINGEVILKCTNCNRNILKSNNEFNKLIEQDKRLSINGIFCSKDCLKEFNSNSSNPTIGDQLNLSLSNYKEFKCIECNKKIILKGESLDNFLRSKKPGPFCSSKCRKKWKSKNKNIKKKIKPSNKIEQNNISTSNESIEIKKPILIEENHISNPINIEGLDPHIKICANPDCRKIFHMTDSQLLRRKRTEKDNPNAAGPFCSRSCQNHYRKYLNNKKEIIK